MPMNDATPDNSDEKKLSSKELAVKLGVLQRETKRLGIPVLVIIEGLDASYKGKLLNQVLLEIDSRSFKLYSTHASHLEPRRYPLLHRFWINTPPKGRIQFYDRSAYYLALDAWAEGHIKKSELKGYGKEIVTFERQLHDSGVHIVKIFLTLSKKEQAKRLTELEENPKTAWRVTPKDWKRNQNHKAYMKQVDKLIEATSPSFAPWTTVNTDHFKQATNEVYELLIQNLQAAVDKAREAAKLPKPERPYPWITYTGHNHLAEVEFEPPMDRAKYKQELKKKQDIVHELVHEVHSKDIPVVAVFCGWDAAGKGGCIKRLVQSIDPRGYDVVPIAAPTQLELNHHYLWRFWTEFPPRGKITIFDRSWYGRVLVERVESLCTNDEWQRAYREINEMEKQLDDFGTCIIKFWLHIDKDTQLERFKARQENPLKRWKITDEDWRNREKWELYEEAVNQMIDNTNTSYAPWNIIPSTCKMRARLNTLDTVIKALEKSLAKPKRPAL